MADLRRAYEEVRSLPDEALGKELSSPTGAIPGYLIMAELDERKALRGGGGNPNPMSMKDELLMGGTIPQPTTQDAMGPSRQYSRGGIISGLNPFNTMMQGMKNPEISGGLLQEQINAAAGGLLGLMS